METIKEFNDELNYIKETSYSGSADWRTLTSFNQDFDCFNRYVEMQAQQAENAGFKGIAEDMRKQKL
jgi:hypothetical protein